jgi:hypothetical protein
MRSFCSQQQCQFLQSAQFLGFADDFGRWSLRLDRTVQGCQIFLMQYTKITKCMYIIYTKYFCYNIPKQKKLYKNVEIYTKWPQNIPKGHKLQIQNGHKIFQINQHFSIPGPSKTYPNGAFGMKFYHLATLEPSQSFFCINYDWETKLRRKFSIHRWSGANPTITSYNAGVVKI